MQRAVVFAFHCSCFSAFFFPESKATTDKLDVIALNSLFKALNSASQLKGGNLMAGIRVEMSGPETIPQLNLSGYLGQFDNLHYLRHLDVSSNNLEGEIPYGFPPNVTHVNMACNRFIKNIPHSLSFLTNLRHFNLSHNLLSGPIGDAFTRLQSLKTMDLSKNKFTGDLPKSFGSLTNLTELFLENNNFTGSVIYLAELLLNYLFWGNRFDTVAMYPPWNFPWDSAPHEQNISSPPSSQQSAMVDYPSSETSERKKRKLSSLGISSVVVGAAAVAICAAVFFAIHIKRSNAKKLESLDSSNSTHNSHIISPSIVAELQLATNSFSEENLLGEGSLGPVYRAEFPDGQAFAMKVINMASLSFDEEEKFIDVIQMASQLRHPNIVRLIGYSVEHDQHLVVYEYVRNLSLEEALHNEVFKPLSWGYVFILLGHWSNYLHSAFHPPASHSNIKAANILLDDELTPRVCDCGLSILRPLTSNSTKTKQASEIAIMNTGYIAPEHGQPVQNLEMSNLWWSGLHSVFIIMSLCNRWLILALEEHFLPARERIRTTHVRNRGSSDTSITEDGDDKEQEFRPRMFEIVEALTPITEDGDDKEQYSNRCPKSWKL
ncbi:DRT111 protein [Hibiscus syriacus]|uniref:DRT111 protein n=1 Tax=Hibiscus syriacus TaxID=106335 RepID=A0A6A2ZEQ2_HIBSY|nr:DRT111 protein [Hibiscus syriacus]